jgi:copper oxidase (laccase) domain-containing protein
MEWRESNGVCWLEADLGGARVAFSTRGGGVSEPPYDSLNLGLLTEDADEAVAENRRRLAAALGFAPEQVVFARQVHGTRLLRHPREEGVVEADGHVVTEPGLAPLVFTADCLPVALHGPGGLAMVHAGWRGLAGGIVGEAAEEVGATCAGRGDVAEGRMLDLPEVARRLLAEAGVEQVESAGLCTSCEAELFFSHRRDHGRTGRQAGIAWIEEG